MDRSKIVTLSPQGEDSQLAGIFFNLGPGRSKKDGSSDSCVVCFMDGHDLEDVEDVLSASIQSPKADSVQGPR